MVTIDPCEWLNFSCFINVKRTNCSSKLVIRCQYFVPNHQFHCLISRSDYDADIVKETTVLGSGLLVLIVGFIDVG